MYVSILRHGKCSYKNRQGPVSGDGELNVHLNLYQLGSRRAISSTARLTSHPPLLLPITLQTFIFWP